ncbi:4960_t:CDS:2, partial [Ambispora leptoticha]
MENIVTEIDNDDLTISLETNTSTELGRAMQGITLLNVNNRIYRIPTCTLPKDFKIKNQNEIISKAVDNKEIVNNGNINDDDINTGKNINETNGINNNLNKINNKNTSKSIKKDLQNEYTTMKINVAQIFHKFIIGKGGKTLNNIQRETSTRIRCSRVEDVIEIRGTEKGIGLAKNRINEIVNSSFNKIGATHFLSLPITDSHVQRKVSNFHSDVLSLSIPGIEPSILNNPSSLHITLGMLTLPRQEDVEGATRLLKELSSEIYDLVGTRTLLAQLTGLNLFDDNPANANVLYSRVIEPEGQKVLDKLVEFLHEKFSKACYLKKEDRPVKFHVTLVNSKYRGRDFHAREDEDTISSDMQSDTTTATPNQDDRNKYSTSQKISFSAELILKKFAEINFGTCRIESLRICKV